jgi:hypothetical protein
MLDNLRTTLEQGEQPRERERRGLVAGDEQRQHLVAQREVRQRLTVGVSRVDQHREQRAVAALDLFAGLDDLVHVAIERALGALELEVVRRGKPVGQRDAVATLAQHLERFAERGVRDIGIVESGATCEDPVRAAARGW